MFDLKDFAERVKRLRMERQLTQQDLGDLLGVSGQAVSKWENGIAAPDIALLPRLAAIFQVTIDELLGYHDVEKSISNTGGHGQEPAQPQRHDDVIQSSDVDHGVRDTADLSHTDTADVSYTDTEQNVVIHMVNGDDLGGMQVKPLIVDLSGESGVSVSGGEPDSPVVSPVQGPAKSITSAIPAVSAIPSTPSIPAAPAIPAIPAIAALPSTIVWPVWKLKRRLRFLGRSEHRRGICVECQQPIDEDMNHCMECHQNYDEDANHCLGCHENYGEDENHCVECHQNYDEDANHCLGCHENYAEDENHCIVCHQNYGEDDNHCLGCHENYNEDEKHCPECHENYSEDEQVCPSCIERAERASRQQRRLWERGNLVKENIPVGQSENPSYNVQDGMCPMCNHARTDDDGAECHYPEMGRLQPQFLCATQVAKRLNEPIETIVRRCENGEIESAFQMTDGLWVILAESVR